MLPGTRRAPQETTMAASSFLPSDDHGEDAGRLFFLSLVPMLFSSFGSPRSRLDDQIGQSRVVQNMGGGVADVEKHLIKRPVRQVPINQGARVFSTPQR